MDSNDPQPQGLDDLDANSETALETLIRFDELAPSELAQLRSNPSAARAIDLMQSTEAYLETGGLAKTGVSADELYAYGAGPGADPLDADRHALVERHLDAVPGEQAWVEGLQVAPPSPLILDRGVSDEDSVAADSSAANPGEAGASIRPEASHLAAMPARQESNTGVNWLVWSPLAAAALILAMALGGGARPSALDGALPASPTLRSGAQARLLFPRGRVLSAEAPSGAFAARPQFEIAPSAKAALFRYELKRLAPAQSEAALFEAGRPLWSVESKERTISANPLSAGAYEWTAWEIIDGVDRELGTMAFQVVQDPDWSTTALQGNGDSEAIIRERVRQLHANGYLTDARNLVRALPESAERESYLADH